MNLQDMAYFIYDTELSDEDYVNLLSENYNDTDTQKEFLSCSEYSSEA